MKNMKSNHAVKSSAIENSKYCVHILSDEKITVIEKSTGLQAIFAPEFEVLYSDTKPQKGSVRIKEVNYAVLAWNENNDFYKAPGIRTRHTALKSTVRNNRITWEFEPGDGYLLEAYLECKDNGEFPELVFTLIPEIKRYYSIGFTGTMGKNIGEVEWIYQPLLWHGKRFPTGAYMTEEARCTLPLVMYGEQGGAVGVFVNPDDMPYRLATMENSRFGVVLRNGEGVAKPSIFAPVFGSDESLLDKCFTFSIKLLVKKLDMFTAVRYIAQNEFKFKDYRQNGTASLNTALDNMVDFIMNKTGENYFLWNERFKCNEYAQDKPGYGRQQSPLAVLALSVVKDDKEIYEKRALPTLEYFLSRKKNMVKTSGDGYDPELPVGNPEPGIMGMPGKSPAINIAEFAMLDCYTKGRNFVFSRYANKLYGIDTSPKNKLSDANLPVDMNKKYTRVEALDNMRIYFRDLMGMYEMTKEPIFLTCARKIADEYIYWRLEQPQPDFVDVKSSFYTYIAPAWYSLIELYDVTGEEKYMDAAAEAIKQFIPFINLSPAIPDCDIELDGESIPAWRVSVSGLTTECAGTAHSHRGIFMPYFAAGVLRAAEHTGDEFLRSVAKASITGRFANYPGYTMRTRYWAKFEKPDYPLKPYKQYSNTAHMNHPMPMACMIIDYLVCDTACRSRKNVYFPSRYTDTAAYFMFRVYGDRPGRFYDDENVWLWLPNGLIRTDHIQANYIAGYGNGKLYIAFTNQCNETIHVNFQLNDRLVTFKEAANAILWEQNENKGSIKVKGGNACVTIAPNGITAIALDDAVANTSFQSRYKASGGKLHEYSFSQTMEPFGRMEGMIISLAAEVTSAFFYTDESPLTTDSVSLFYSIDGQKWKSMLKKEYPFEFTLPLSGNETEIKYYMVDSEGRKSSEQGLWVSTAKKPAFKERAEFIYKDPELPVINKAEENKNQKGDWIELYKYGFEIGDMNLWRFNGGRWEVAYNGEKVVLQQSNVEEDASAYIANKEIKDYMINADIRFMNNTTIISSGLIARYTDNGNYYLMKLFSDTNCVQLIKNFQGKLEVMGEVPLKVNPSKWYNLKLTVNGSSIICYVDDVKKISVTDSDRLNNGFPGIMTFQEAVEVGSFTLSVLK